MHWGSVSEFMAMGGHGFWVWLAWGAALAALAMEQIVIRASRRSLLAEIRRQAAAEEALEADEEEESR